MSASCLEGSGALHGHLVCDRPAEELSDDDRTAIEQARQFLEVEMQRIEAVRRERAKFATELIDLLEDGEPRRAELNARLDRFKLDCEKGICVLAVALEPGAEEGIVASAAEWCFDRLKAASVTALRDSEILVLAGPTGDEPEPAPATSYEEALASALLAALPGRTVRIGVGSEAHDVKGLYRSMVEARNSLRLTSAERPIAAHSSLATHRSLMDLQDPEVAGAFERTLLGPLEEHDERRGTALVETLQVFLDEGGHWKESAERLHVHVNTLRHRLERVSALTGRDLSTMDARVDFYLALDVRRHRTGSSGHDRVGGASSKASVGTSEIRPLAS